MRKFPFKIDDENAQGEQLIYDADDQLMAIVPDKETAEWIVEQSVICDKVAKYGSICEAVNSEDLINK